jgi:D-3-phosphoglycerate dehydrogenase / 2-oxoglutarate reductase
VTAPDHPITIVLAHGTFTDAKVEVARAAGRARCVVAPLRTPNDVVRHTADTDAVIVTNHPLSQAHIDALGSAVRLIARAGIGLDAIDLEAARRRGVGVYHVPDYATAEVATHAVSMLLALHRKIKHADEIAGRDWSAWTELKPIVSIEELVVGLVGCGRIGRAVAARLRPFAATIRAFDPHAPVEDAGIESSASLRELLATSDIISLHLPLTDETTGMISAEAISEMRDGALLVNVSRGALVDEAALVSALESGKLGGAALDVLAEEPPRGDAPILSAPRVLLSPHVAWYSDSAERRLRENVVEAVLAILGGRRPEIGRLAVEVGRAS